MVAYVDTSVVVAVTLGEVGGKKLLKRLRRYRLVASPLLEAEWRSACARSGVVADAGQLREIAWIVPPGTLSSELSRVLATGYVRGADAWHLAAALYLAPTPAELTFLTLDARQREVAATLGFDAPEP
jgi:predicted nucleic acid-binding protein